VMRLTSLAFSSQLSAISFPATNRWQLRADS
jgi:hypothetical protein